MRNTSRRVKAFTLIELLVVIAIIAILAAILFPVFAQARAAARGAASQSNIRQLSLGVLMYLQDYDEHFPMDFSWGDTNTPIEIGGVDFTMWSYQISPYLKNLGLFADPLVKGTQQFPDWEEPFYTDYGYNYTTLSPSTTSSGPWIYNGALLASINQPSGTVMLGGRSDATEMNGLWWYGPETMLDVGGVEAPDCADIPAWCWSDWAPNGNVNGALTVNTDVSGFYTGFNALRKAVNGNWSFVDGHCKYMQAGAAAQGTNWYHGALSGTIHITNSSIYMWQVQQ